MYLLWCCQKYSGLKEMWRQKKSYILDLLRGFFVTIQSFLKWHKTDKSEKYTSQWYYNRLGLATVWQFIWVCTSLWCVEILLWADVPVLFTQERSWTAACFRISKLMKSLCLTLNENVGDWKYTVRGKWLSSSFLWSYWKNNIAYFEMKY